MAQCTVSGSPLKRSTQHGTTTSWAADIISSMAVGVEGIGELLLHPASANVSSWVWQHEGPIFTVPCCAIGEPCDSPARETC